MDIREAFSDAPVIDLTGGNVQKKAQGVVDVSSLVADDDEIDVPTGASLKAEVYDYLRSQGYDEDDLDGKTKAELLELV